MTTYHVYKTDCAGASRVMLQSDWEGRSSGFIHIPKIARERGERPEYDYGLISIIRVLKAAAADQSLSLVFHAQSSLPLLLGIYCLRWFVRGGRRAIFVYDIHDLHEHEPYHSTFERVRYGILRYYPLRWLERWALSRPNIQVLTVSDGLADTIVEWYGCTRPTVVHSAMRPQRSAAELGTTPRHPKALLFFGTAERLPFELIEDVGRAGLELHLYGRFGGREGLEYKLDKKLPEHVRVFGEYSPEDLDFISRYKFLLIFKPEDRRANFRYSLPNKFFQSLGYGTSLILSANFEEMAKIACAVPGACSVLHDRKDLVAAIATLDLLQEGKHMHSLIDLSFSLHNQARERYLSVIHGDQL